MLENTINDDKTIAGGIGTMLAGRYHILRQLGEGGMGSVWLAEDRQLDNRKVAIKMLPSIVVTDKRAYQQLKSEALVSLKLVHPNIVTLRTFEENYGNPFLVMDYIEGQTLSDYLAEKGKLSEAETVNLLRPIATALDYAHGEKVIHRDVKPSNIIIRKDGHPFILDFGIAREIQESMTRVTGRTISGTLLYMSPEQLRGALPAPAQDVYSFAAMCYECLKGEPPFTRGEIAYQILNEKPVRLMCEAQLVTSVMAGLAKKPQDRPQTCTSVLKSAELSLCLGQNDLARNVRQAIKAYQEKDYIHAFAAAQNADKSDPQIQNIIGHCFADGLACAKNTVEAVKWFRMAAEQGHVTAQYKLGLIYEKGQGVTRNIKEAIRWYRMSAEQGFSSAQFKLGVMYGYGGVDGVEGRAEAVRWCRMAAEQGEIEAQYILGRMYEYGRCVKRDMGLAIGWYRMAAEQGSVKAQFHLGWLYGNGRGVINDNAEAVKWTRMAAEQGYASAQYNLGLMYEDGRGVAKDERAAAVWYQKAAEKGDENAQNSLGLMYEEGRGVMQNQEEAVKWFREAAERGYDIAQYNLGRMYEEGLGVAKDEAEAVKWYREAAEQGYDYAQCNLGSMYEEGRGVVKDETEAVKWYRKAAEAGYGSAQCYLGKMYEIGRGVTKNEAEAVKWYRKAAEQGLATAQCNLGVMYANGLGVKCDEKVAVMYFRMAADQNLALAQYNLGVMYAKGQGVKQDTNEAELWFRKAAEQGSKSAREALRKKGLQW